MTLRPGYLRSAVDLVLERRKLARREEVVTAVFGPDLGHPASVGGTWVPSSPDHQWSCATDGHLFTGTDPANCVYCGVELP